MHPPMDSCTHLYEFVQPSTHRHTDDGRDSRRNKQQPPHKCEILFRDGYKYNGTVGGWLKLHTIQATWHDARLRCHYEGAVLASPLSENLRDAMTQMMMEGKRYRPHVVYTGIHASFSKGDFTSIEGVPLVKIPVSWNNDQNSKDDCVHMTQGGSVHIISCNYLNAFICYKKDQDDLKKSICGLEKDGYKYDERSSKCYKVHTQGRTWSRGFMTCLAEDAHLAIINSQLEAQVIKDLLAEHPVEKMLADYTHVASVGFSDWGERGSWWSIHGETLEQAGYAEWENNKPDSKTQYCGGVNRSGKFNDIWCNNETFPLICEKSPTTTEMEPVQISLLRQ